MENFDLKSDVRELSLEETDLVSGGALIDDVISAGKSILMAVIGPFIGGTGEPPMPDNPVPWPTGPATGSGPRGGGCPGPCHGHRPM